MAISRISSGITGLDEVTNGGLIQNHSYLVVGSAGTGKTIGSLQWLLHGAENGLKGLYVTLAEPLNNIRRNVAGFGWSLDEIEVVDLNPLGEPSGAEGVEEYNVFPPSDVERTSMWDALYEALEEKEPDLVVVDSVTQLRYLSTDDYQFRKQILNLVAYLFRRGCTSFLTYEPSELEHEASIALAVDGIMRLRMDISRNRVVGLRSLQVEKLRGSSFLSGLHPLRITAEGLKIFPHRIETPSDAQPGEHVLSSGIRNLDDLLGGGIESATSTIISGPSGAGKTTLGMQFMVTAVREGLPAVVYAFEESPVSIVERCSSIGMPVRAMLASGGLRMVRVNPMELYPDEFLRMVREDVLNDGRKAVMVDSLRGYDLAMEEYGTPVAHVHNLTTFLNAEGISSFFINEVEEITGNIVATGLGVSYVMDNILLLRYAEQDAELIRIIACLKKRHGPFQSSIRRLQITPDGMEVGGEAAQQLSHSRPERPVLIGLPSFSNPPQKKRESAQGVAGP